MARKVKPTGNRVLVRLRRDLQKVGSIWLPDGGQNLDVVCSEVIAVGPDVRPWDIHPGDFVLHVRVVGVSYDGTLGTLGRQAVTKTANYKILLQSECMAVVDPEAVGKVEGQAEYDEGRVGARDTRSL